MSAQEFKTDIVNTLNELTYWMDFLPPRFNLKNISVDAIGPRIFSKQQDNIIRLYDTTIPNNIIISQGMTEEKETWIRNKCTEENQKDPSTVRPKVYKKFSHWLCWLFCARSYKKFDLFIY